MKKKLFDYLMWKTTSLHIYDDYGIFDVLNEHGEEMTREEIKQIALALAWAACEHGNDHLNKDVAWALRENITVEED